LVREGKAQDADIHPWIMAIAQETYGWSQHIMMYAQTAAELLKARKGQVTPEDLDLVLQDGRVGKRDYYWDRPGFLLENKTRALARAVQDTSPSGRLGKMILLERLMDNGPMSEEQALKLFHKLLHKCVLSPVQKSFGVYEFPFPQWVPRQA